MEQQIHVAMEPPGVIKELKLEIGVQKSDIWDIITNRSMALNFMGTKLTAKTKRTTSVPLLNLISL